MDSSKPSLVKCVLLTILTVYFPPVGAWFLVKPSMPWGLRIFAVIWSCLYAIAALLVDNPLAVRIVFFIATLLPIAYFLYLIKKDHDRKVQAKTDEMYRNVANILNQPKMSSDDAKLKELEEKYSNL